MCTRPRYIKNPQFIDLGYKGSINGDWDHVPQPSDCRYPDRLQEVYKLIASGEARNMNISQRYIQVPCGRCSECIHCRQNSFTQRAYFESLNSWTYFVTLTYNDDMIPRAVDSLGHDCMYADPMDFSKMIRRIRDGHMIPGHRSIRYAFCTEFGGQRHRPHFHALIFIQKYDTDPDNYGKQFEHFMYELIFSQWKRKIGGTASDARFKPLFTFSQCGVHRNFDLHFVEPYVQAKDGRWLDSSSVFYYVSKYMMKVDPYVDELYHSLKSDYGLEVGSLFQQDVDEDEIDSVKAEFKSYWRLIRPCSYWSKNFGITPLSKTCVLDAYDKYIRLATACPGMLMPDGSPLDDNRLNIRLPDSDITQHICHYFVVKYVQTDEKLMECLWTLKPKPRTDFDKSFTDEDDFDEVDMSQRIERGRHLFDKYYHNYCTPVQQELFDEMFGYLI